MSVEETINADEVFPSMPKRKLSPEARRISRVLENCISQIEIAASIPAILQSHAVVDEDLSKLLQAHQVLEDRLEKLECQELNSDGLQKQEAEKAKRIEMDRLGKRIKNSVRDVSRYFRLHPTVLADLREKISMKVGESERILIRKLQEFHSYVVNRLCSEEDPRVPQIQLSSSLNQTLEQLILEEEECAAVLKEMDETILKIDCEIKQLERHQEGPHVEAEDETSLQDEQEQLNLICAENLCLKQQIDRVNMQLSTLMLENRKAERILQEKNESLKKEIENTLRCFDKEMEEIQAKLELNEQGYVKELEEVRKLEEPFRVLEEQYNEILERRRLAEEKKKEEMRQLELKTKAGIIIQAWWRGYSVRKSLKKKAKKNKKAKKGKKTK